jgi:hypothetical protein
MWYYLMWSDFDIDSIMLFTMLWKRSIVGQNDKQENQELWLLSVISYIRHEWQIIVTVKRMQADLWKMILFLFSEQKNT